MIVFQRICVLRNCRYADMNQITSENKPLYIMVYTYIIIYNMYVPLYVLYIFKPLHHT